MKDYTCQGCKNVNDCDYTDEDCSRKGGYIPNRARHICLKCEKHCKKVYIRINEKRFRTWKPIGFFCDACKVFYSS